MFMSGTEKPLYVVTYLDKWVTYAALINSNDISVPAFGTREEAERFLRDDARERGTRLRDYEIHEFENAKALAKR
jgi:hypothetical protein